MSIKDVLSQGGFPEEVLQMRASKLFGVKNIGFFDIYGAVSARTRRWVN